MKCYSHLCPLQPNSTFNFWMFCSNGPNVAAHPHWVHSSHRSHLYFSLLGFRDSRLCVRVNSFSTSALFSCHNCFRVGRDVFYPPLRIHISPAFLREVFNQKPGIHHLCLFLSADLLAVFLLFLNLSTGCWIISLPASLSEFSFISISSGSTRVAFRIPPILLLGSVSSQSSADYVSDMILIYLFRHLAPDYKGHWFCLLH